MTTYLVMKNWNAIVCKGAGGQKVRVYGLGIKN